jgi:hypothetical protein
MSSVSDWQMGHLRVIEPPKGGDIQERTDCRYFSKVRPPKRAKSEAIFRDCFAMF